MTIEDKQLLIKDICSRVPYRPKVKVLHVWNEEKEIEEDIVDTVYCVLPEGYINTETIDSDIPLNDNVILYLRSLSSMTEEEAAEFEILSDKLLMEADNTKIWNSVVDWLNEHAFDHRGLIPIGLASEAPEWMYKISNE